jgi:hypothetical protein
MEDEGLQLRVARAKNNRMGVSFIFVAGFLIL